MPWWRLWQIYPDEWGSLKNARDKERLHPLAVLPPVFPDGGPDTRVHPTRTQTWLRGSIVVWIKMDEAGDNLRWGHYWRDSMSDKEEQPAPRWRKTLKSGLHWTGATRELNKVTGPHEVAYTSAGKPAAYQDISIPFFVQGYLITLDSEEDPSDSRWPPTWRS